MKLRFYMRGLGIGIIITVLLMSILARSGNAGELSDEEIRARAARLGMVEGQSGVLSDLVRTANPKERDVSGSDTDLTPAATQKPDSTSASDSTKEPANSSTFTATPKPANSSTSTAAPKPANASTPTAAPKPANSSTPAASKKPDNSSAPVSESEQPNGNEQGASNETVTITIKKGVSSETVSRILAEAELVDDAAVYNKYLCDNGYDQFMRAGVFKIPKGSSGEEIAKIISGR